MNIVYGSWIRNEYVIMIQRMNISWTKYKN